MKKLIFSTSLGLAMISGVKAQIGINTTAPQGVLHIDAKNNTSGSTNTSDDFIIKEDGKVGIGTINPQSTLEINGKIKITDDRYKSDMILTSGSDGTTSWQRRAIGTSYYSVQNINTSLQGSIVENVTTPKRMEASIILPPGTYQVMFSATYRNITANIINIWWDLVEGATFNSSLRIGRVLSSAAPSNGLASVNAIYTLTNNTTVNKTYYIYSTSLNMVAKGTATFFGDAKLYAFKLN